jgi:phage tail tape-measure protein
MKSKKQPAAGPAPADAEPTPKEPVAVGTAIGSAGGAVAGAIVGAAVGGPIGATVGGTIGAVVGGTAGHSLVQAVNPTIEREYWSENYQTRPYYRPGKEYSHYEPAYRLGWESAEREEYRDKPFDDVEPELRRTWKGGESAGDPWTDAREATRDAWLRVRAR